MDYFKKFVGKSGRLMKLWNEIELSTVYFQVGAYLSPTIAFLCLYYRMKFHRLDLAAKLVQKTQKKIAQL